MNKPITNADTINCLQERLKAIDYDRANVVKAINILTATALVAQDTAIKKLRTPSKESQRRVKGKRNVRRKERLPWHPSKNASPFVQVLYDALEDGEAISTAQLVIRVGRKGFDGVTEQQVRSALQWMRRSDRLTENRGKWRRKHARYASKDKPITSDEITGKNAHKVMGRLDVRVEKGELVKTVSDKGLITWTPVENTTAPSTEVSQ